MVKIPTWAKVLIFCTCWPAALMGCATPLPPCEKFGYSIVNDNNGQQFVVMDMDNTEKLIGLISGISAGKCRLPKDGEV